MVVVGTRNLENLFRPGGDDAGPSDDAAYQAKLDTPAGVINRLAPDVLAVQEVGDPEALADLAGKLSGSWHAELSAFPDDRHIRVGFLSQHPLSDVRHVRDFPTGLAPVQVADDGTTIEAMGRGALRVRIVLAGHELDLVTCHLKSKLLTFGGGRFSTDDEGERARVGAYALYRRAAEAVTVRAAADALLDGHGDERAVIVLGDLNDERSRPRRRSCSDHPARRSARPDSRNPATATHADCGTSRRGSPRSAGLRVCSAGARS
jgi:endonuclease/exonuclease/phosphatase family metal-dependent hydrolase